MLKRILILPMMFVMTLAFAGAGPASASAPQTKTVVYYFSSCGRCAAHSGAEGYTRGAIDQNFAHEIMDGRMEFQSTDTKKKENKHFLKDYGLYTESVVLSRVADGKEVKFKNLDQIWKFGGREDAFKKYITDETAAFMGE